MKNTLQELQTESAAMDKNGAMAKLGLRDEASLSRLAEVLNQHELGITPRGFMIYVRGWLQRNGKVFGEIMHDERALSEFRVGVTSSSSVSRAIPLGVVMQEHLASNSQHEETTVIDLASGRAHASQVLLYPEILGREFFRKFRIAMSPANMPKVAGVVAVDRRVPDFDESTQVYLGSQDKMEVFKELENRGYHDGRLVRLERDIRTLKPDELRAHMRPDTNGVILLNNVLYQVVGDTRHQIEEAVNNLAAELGMPILQMETWQVFGDKKPTEGIPGQSFGEPAYVRVGKNLNKMKTVATLDGTTGKPFRYVDKSGKDVWMDKEGTVSAI